MDGYEARLSAHRRRGTHKVALQFDEQKAGPAFRPRSWPLPIPPVWPALRHSLLAEWGSKRNFFERSPMREARPTWIWLLLPAVAVMLASCKPDTKADAPEVRPVRTVTAEKGGAGENVVLTGHVKAE